MIGGKMKKITSVVIFYLLLICCNKNNKMENNNNMEDEISTQIVTEIENETDTQIVAEKDLAVYEVSDNINIIGVWGLLNDDSEHHHYRFYPDQKYWEGFMFGRIGEWYINDNVLSLIEKAYYLDVPPDVENLWIVPEEIIMNFSFSLVDEYTITLSLINTDIIDKLYLLDIDNYYLNEYLYNKELYLKRIEMMENHYWWLLQAERFW
jgi:hypothetical protein